VMPYALSSTAQGRTPVHALSHAIVGALLCGDAAEVSAPLDRYKLLALQCKLGGMPPAHIAESLAGHIASDVTHEAARCQADPGVYFQVLAAQLASEGKPPSAPEPRAIAQAIVSVAGGFKLRRVVGMSDDVVRF
jgi:hypothetical protein